LFDKEINRLEGEWSSEEGFLWLLRQGRFDERSYESLLSFLRSVADEEGEALPKRLVSVLWYIPLFMEWQTDRISKAGHSKDAYQRAVAVVRNEVERILGLP
jgi:hypothetical protein